MQSYKIPLVGILRNANPDSKQDWTEACRDYGVKYSVIDLSAWDWMLSIQSADFDFFVYQPEGLNEGLKTQFDERLYVLNKLMGKKIYPSYEECILYENKKMLSYYLEAKKIPHPKTHVFYRFHEARSFVSSTTYPLVAKTSIGAAGTGVRILNNYTEALYYIRKAFYGRGIRRRFGPNPNLGNPKSWLIKTLHDPRFFAKRLKMYLSIEANAQRGYVIFQEYIPHEYEWRLVKIDDSFFAHKKLKVGQKASGGKKKEFGMPPKELMDYFDSLCIENGFDSVDIDVFERGDEYLVNEIQCVFGVPYKYLLKIEDQIGRLVKAGADWKFEPGDFAKNSCCNLRLKKALKLYCPEYSI